MSQVSTDLEEARAVYGHALAEALLIKGSAVKPAKAVIDRVVARLLDAQSEVLHLEAEAGVGRDPEQDPPGRERIEPPRPESDGAQ